MKRFCIIFSILFASTAPAADRAALDFFETEIRPLLASECFKCHGPKKAKAGLRLDHLDAILKGGESGPAVIPGQSEKSLLIKAVRRGDPELEMPPDKALSRSAIAKLERWISTGAVWPIEAANRMAVDKNGFTAEDRAWWAIQPVREPRIPTMEAGWARNEIDHFVAAALSSAKLNPAPEASRSEMVRRVYFDLHGLPPTPEQVSAFVHDTRPDAWMRLIKQLLDSPRYGERWGQHWLDVVRYAESDGYREDAFRPDAYVYRDYVIRSFNEDKPYNQFVREQLAGDEIAPDEPDRFIGTAFLRQGIYEWNQRNARMHWELIVNELTSVTGEVFLGLGIGCAQCHDHKFDPILQKDYYSLQAFLSSTAWPLEAPLASRKVVTEYERKLAGWERMTKTVRDEMQALVRATYDGKVNSTVKQFPEDIQQMYAKKAGERTPYEEQLVYLVERQVVRANVSFDAPKALKGKPEKLKRYLELESQLKKFEDRKPKPLPQAFVASDIGCNPTQTFLKSRSGQLSIEPAFLTLLGQPAPSIHPTSTTTGRRRALADWIARDENPLATRVIVNRIWQRHFQRGIVATPNDFGRLGEAPSHPELLDWLTRRFLEGGWRFKPLHELILNSATYRQTARREPGQPEQMIDPGNRLLWRFPVQRLDAEQVRDGMLAVSGELKQRDGGASVSGDSPHRSVYVKKLRNRPDAMLNGFDAPVGFDSAPDRIATTTPVQSLLLVNGAWTLARAKALARRLLDGNSQLTGEKIERAYELVFGRSPKDDEIAAGLDFIKAQTGTVKSSIEVADKFPNETGLRPIIQMFKNITGFSLGEQALWLQPGSRFERLHLPETKLADDEFTIEAIAILDRLYADASVNTLISRWNGDSHTAGWTFGVTSQKSRYQPRNFIVQLVGENFQGNTVYDVVASDLRFPLGKPVYFAAAITADTSSERKTSGTVTFYLKDLSDPKAQLESRTVETSVVGKIQSPAVNLLTGGRDGKGHLWDGQLARLTVSRGALKRDELFLENDAAGGTRIIDWKFSKNSESIPAPGTRWFRATAKAGTVGAPVRLLEAVTDFCHVLLNSNEFLYLN